MQKRSREFGHKPPVDMSNPTCMCSEIVGEYGTRPLYKLLGYFSVIGLLRVHSLLGDFTLALKVMENVELNQKVSHRRYISHSVMPT